MRESYLWMYRLYFQYERYKDFAAEQCVIQSGGVFCPNTGCGEGMIVDDRATTVRCQTCQVSAVFMFQGSLL